MLVSHLLGRFLMLPHDPKEPPLIPSRIPFIGHVIGLLRHGSGYYSETAKKYNLPIFTLGLPRGKIYVVTSPSLVAACDRRSKIVSFAPYVVDFARRLLVASQSSIDLLSEDLLGEKGPVTLRAGTMNAMHQTLKPGGSLTEITQTMLEDLSKFLCSPIHDNEEGLLLFEWIRSFVTLASTNAIYGSDKNPMQNPEVANGLWAVDKHFAFLGLMVLPDLIAPEGSRGRKRFFNAFREYYASGGLETSSQFVKKRYEVNTKHGVSDEDIAHFDLGVCTALLVNTVPGVFWALYHVFSNRLLLDEIREGIELVIYRQGRHKALTVNIAKVIEAFPLLESLVKEVLRVQSTNASARFLLKDILIDDGNGGTYLLKKDSFLGMPSGPLHSSEAIWGPNAHRLDPTRFLKERQLGIPASAKRTFGGGSSLCPGRYFAMNEITSVLIIMVLRYNIEPIEGKWKTPKARHHISTSILTPVDDVRVRVLPREEVRDVSWTFVWQGEKDE